MVVVQLKMKRRKPPKKLLLSIVIPFILLVLLYIFLFKQVFSSVMIWFPWSSTQLGTIYLTFGKAEITLPINSEEAYKSYGFVFHRGYISTRSKADRIAHHDPWVYVKFIDRPYQDRYTKANLKVITSKNNGITFRTPEGFESTYNYRGFDGQYAESFEYKKGYRMTIRIFDKTLPKEYCHISPLYMNSSKVTTVMLAGKFPIEFIATDIDGRKGWTASRGYYFIDEKSSCIEVYKEHSGDIAQYFDQILESAEYDLSWWKRW